MSTHHLNVPKNVGLALGSGSARGWAHIGVIRALTEAGVTIKFVAGTSIGSLVGAAFTLGKIGDLEEFACQLDWKQIVSLLDVTLPRSGLIDGKKLTNLFRGYVQNIDIESLPLPFRAVATDLASGRETVLGSGDLIDAVRASISIPGIFTPVKRNGAFLVDGGLVNPVPVSVARNMGADYVIAVDLHTNNTSSRWAPENAAKEQPGEDLADQPSPAKWEITTKLAKTITELGSPAMAQVRTWLSPDPVPSIFDVVTASISIMESRITAIRLAADPPDLLLQPKVGHIRSLEFHRAKEAISAGHREAVARLGSSFRQ